MTLKYLSGLPISILKAEDCQALSPRQARGRGRTGRPWSGFSPQEGPTQGGRRWSLPSVHSTLSSLVPLLVTDTRCDPVSANKGWLTESRLHMLSRLY